MSGYGGESMHNRQLELLCIIPLYLAACSAGLAGVGPMSVESGGSDPTDEERARVIRETCLRSLKDIRDKTEQLIVKYPATLGHLDHGVIDEAALSLHFPVTDERMKFRKGLGRSRAPLIPLREGVHVQLVRQARTAGIGTATRPAPQTHFWPFIDVRFEWSWSWPNRPFDLESYGEFHDILRQSLRPLIDLESSTSAGVLHGQGKESFVLYGRPGFEIELRPDSDLEHDGSCGVAVFVKNTTSGVLAFVPNTTVELILNGAAEPDRLLDQFGRLQLWHLPGHGSPFVVLQPDEVRQLGSVGFGPLESGVHSVRIVKHHFDNGWTDMRPTYHDGSPEYLRVMLAWIGVVVSNEVTVVVPSGPTAPTARPTP